MNLGITAALTKRHTCMSNYFPSTVYDIMALCLKLLEGPSGK